VFNKFGAYIKNNLRLLFVHIKMKARFNKRIIAILATLMLPGICNIACTKAGNGNQAMAQDTTTHITDTTHVPGTTQAPQDTVHITYLALGDSYTIGQSVAEDERFPAQTVAALLTDSIQLTAPQYIATTGWTTVDLQNAITQQNPVGPYGAVTLLIGVNDQYQHLDTGGYRTRFTLLLQKAVQLAGNRKDRVFVLSIPDYSVTPFGGGSTTIRDQIDGFNAINQQITLANNIAYINITDISRQAATDPTLIAGDGLHPSGKQYALWVQALAPVMEKALK
jgi:lysophospholipase L1-like esterase